MKPLRGPVVALGLALGLVLGAPPEGHAGSAKPPKAAPPAKPKKVASKKKPPPAPLDGTTYDFTYDGKDVGHTERAWLGRSFVHKKAAADPVKALPLLVFVHGLNTELIKYRWMGGGNEGDVRRIVAEMIEAGQIPPMLVAGPSSVVPQNIVVAQASWMAFDLDHFVAKTEAALKGVATIDKTKIIVAGHSGGGCNIKGGIATAIKAKNVHTVMSIDTCMGTDLATALAQAKKSMNVIVSWQAITWANRPLKDFRTVFEREVKKSPADTGILRTLDPMTPNIPSPHDAMVGLTLKKWLPVLLPVSKPASAPAASSAAPASSSAPIAPASSSVPPASSSAPIAPSTSAP